MHKRLAIIAALIMAVSGTGVVTAGGSSRVDPVVPAEGANARTTWNGGAPIVPSAGSPLATASVFLAAGGATPRTIASLRIERTHTWLGVTHVWLRQEVEGLRVAGAYAKLAFDERGALINVIDQLVAVPGSVGATAVPPEAALHVAISAVIPQVAERPAVARRAADLVTFVRTPAFAEAPAARQVLVARESGRLERAWQVTTWTRDNLLDVTLVDAAGLMAGTERRTASDSYNVFEEDPGKTAQGIVSSPASATASAGGWLSGNQTTIQISGPNAKAYLDRDANNLPDAGGTSVSNGNFVTAADLTKQPTIAANQAVAVQNLFYLNNITHDLLYGYGFTQSAGNFQGSDPVFAEAQDGSGMDNANMSTPADGSSPRMQMYLWSSPDPSHEVVINNSTIKNAFGASFGPALDTTGKSGTLAWVADGVGVSSDGCESLPRKSMNGKIAIADRGTCSFVTKVKNAGAAGAVGVIVVSDGLAFTMGGSTSVSIPSVMVDKSVGTSLVNGQGGRIRLKSAELIQLDGDVDSDIVYHEYTHGLTWRMIGSMSGSMSGAIGEGASDALSLFINRDPAIGEYSMGNTDGIRSKTYDKMTKTYASMTTGEVHADGEVYGQIAWAILQRYLGSGPGVPALMTTWVDGMNYTPSGPNMKDMRDGMLKSVGARLGQNANLAGQCTIIREEFARAGVGNDSSATFTPRGGWKPVNGFTVGSGCLQP